MSIREKLKEIERLNEVNYAEAESTSLITKEIEDHFHKIKFHEVFIYFHNDTRINLKWDEHRQKQWRLCVFVDHLGIPEWIPVTETNAKIRENLKCIIIDFLDALILFLNKK